MALIHCDFFSQVLKLSTSMCVALPEVNTAPAKRMKLHPTLYLLHGLSDDHTIWQRRTSIERYAADYNLAVVMPTVHRGFYTDMAQGPRYWTFISEEVPYVAQTLFRLSAKREDNFVAGLSMGGYGAFKLALRCPEQYAAAASLSGAVDIAGRCMLWSAEYRAEMERIFGPIDQLAGSKNDLMALAKTFARKKTPRPLLYQCCGTEDTLYESNIRFRDHARSLRIDLTYEEGPGQHEWVYWDKMIQRVLEWLPLKKTR